VKLRAQFTNSDFALFPNQFVNARMLVDTLREATVLPTAAVQRGSQGTFVYVVREDSTVTVRPVKLGPVQGELVAVESGVTPGESVVTDGGDRLREGARVEIADRSLRPEKGGGKGRGRGKGGGGEGKSAEGAQPATGEQPAPAPKAPADNQPVRERRDAQKDAAAAKGEAPRERGKGEGRGKREGETDEERERRRAEWRNKSDAEKAEWRKKREERQQERQQ
jgi:multidrug efflux system membrane fusion protein